MSHVRSQREVETQDDGHDEDEEDKVCEEVTSAGSKQLCFRVCTVTCSLFREGAGRGWGVLTARIRHHLPCLRSNLMSFPPPPDVGKKKLTVPAISSASASPPSPEKAHFSNGRHSASVLTRDATSVAASSAQIGFTSRLYFSSPSTRRE